MATSLIQKIAIEAYKAFKHVTPKPDISKLCELLSQVHADDVGLDGNLFSNTNSTTGHKGIFKMGDAAPVKYVHIWEDDIFTMGIFVLRSGFTIPLHDHPKMFGLIKVIQGSAKIQSYTALEKDNIPEELQDSLNQYSSEINPNRNSKLLPTYKHNPVTLTAESDSAVLYPMDNNFHDVQAVDGVTAFIDVISPPYDDNLTCTYYKDVSGDLERDCGGLKLSFSREKLKHLAILSEIALPSNFWCQPSSYDGPTITPDIIYKT